MIIKSRTRKSPSYKQAINYILAKRRPNNDWIYLHNIDAGIEDTQEIVSEFSVNNTYRKKRKNGIAMYHEILSFSNLDKKFISQNSWVLEDLTIEYIYKRAPHALVFACPHYDTNHPHVHIIISANKFHCAKTNRISQKQFARIKSHMERVMLKRYPQLEKSHIKKHISVGRSK